MANLGAYSFGLIKEKAGFLLRKREKDQSVLKVCQR